MSATQASVISLTTALGDAASQQATCDATVRTLHTQVAELVTQVVIFSSGLQQCNATCPGFVWDISAADWNATYSSIGEPFSQSQPGNMPQSWPVGTSAAELSVAQASLASCVSSRGADTLSLAVSASALATCDASLSVASTQSSACGVQLTQLSMNASASAAQALAVTARNTVLTNNVLLVSTELAQSHALYTSSMLNASLALAACRGSSQAGSLACSLSGLTEELGMTVNQLSGQLATCSASLQVCFANTVDPSILALCQSNLNGTRTQLTVSTTTSAACNAQLSSVSSASAQCFAELSLSSGRPLPATPVLSWPWLAVSPSPRPQLTAASSSPLPSLVSPPHLVPSTMPVPLPGALTEEPFYYLAADGTLVYQVTFYHAAASLATALSDSDSATALALRTVISTNIGLQPEHVSVSSATCTLPSAAPLATSLCHVVATLHIQIPRSVSMEAAAAIVSRLRLTSPNVLLYGFLTAPEAVVGGVGANSTLSATTATSPLGNLCTSLTAPGGAQSGPHSSIEVWVIGALVAAFIGGSCIALGLAAAWRRKRKAQSKAPRSGKKGADASVPHRLGSGQVNEHFAPGAATNAMGTTSGARANALQLIHGRKNASSAATVTRRSPLAGAKNSTHGGRAGGGGVQMALSAGASEDRTILYANPLVHHSTNTDSKAAAPTTGIAAVPSPGGTQIVRKVNERMAVRSPLLKGANSASALRLAKLTPMSAQMTTDPGSRTPRFIHRVEFSPELSPNYDVSMSTDRVV